MFIVIHRKIFFTISGILLLASLVAPFIFGLPLSTDFLGGSILEVSYVNPDDRPNLDTARSSVGSLSLGNVSLRPSGEANLVMRSKELSLEDKQSVLSALSQNGSVEIKEERFNSVGPIVGESLKRKSFIAIGMVILGIVFFITFAFRKVSLPVPSWKYGLSAIIALVHDIVVPTGIYIIFGRYFGAEIDLLFVTALLAILGYSIHDTIVVFDRVRENLRLNEESRNQEEFEVTVGKSISQTMARSINTSVTIFITLLALFLIGSESTRAFSFILLVGVVAGTYSSIFVGSPLLVTLEKLQKKAK